MVMFIPPAEIIQVDDMRASINAYLKKNFPSEQLVVSVYKNGQKHLIELYSMKIDNNRISEVWCLYAPGQKKQLIPVDASCATRGNKEGRVVWRVQGEPVLETGDFELDYSFNWVPNPKPIP